MVDPEKWAYMLREYARTITVRKQLALMADSLTSGLAKNSVRLFATGYHYLFSDIRF
jgi:hypothetical protein